jgi:hypothetical protein
MSKRYVGVLNYTNNRLPITKMVAFEHDIDAAKTAIDEHASDNNIDLLKNYHIAVYECEDWGDQNGNDIPVKIETIYP